MFLISSNMIKQISRYLLITASILYVQFPAFAEDLAEQAPERLASIEDPDVIQKILKHLGLDQTEDPRNRSPPTDLIDQQTTLF